MRLNNKLNDYIGCKKNVNYCSFCYNIEEIVCYHICSDQDQNMGRCVYLNKTTDIFIIKNGFYDGTYHVLLGQVSPLENVNSSDIIYR